MAPVDLQAAFGIMVPDLLDHHTGDLGCVAVFGEIGSCFFQVVHYNFPIISGLSLICGRGAGFPDPFQYPSRAPLRIPLSDVKAVCLLYDSRAGWSPDC